MQKRLPFYFILFLVISTLAYTPAFLRDNPYGFDTYFFLYQVCSENPHKDEFLAPRTQPILGNLIEEALPCNITTIKILFFTCMLLSALFCGLLASQFRANGFIAATLIYATPVFTLEFYKFENDAIAYPILFAATWLFYTGLKQKNTTKQAIAITTTIVTLFLWEGSLLYTIVFLSTYAWFSIPFFLGSIALQQKFQELFITKIAPTLHSATENLPAYGMLYQFFLIPALMYIKYTPLLIAPTVLFSLLAFINSKFAIHASFFLAIGASALMQRAETNLMKYLPLAGAIFMACFLFVLGPSLPPDSQEFTAAELAVISAEGQPICNEWGTGHLIRYLGGNPMAFGGGEQLDCSKHEGIVLSYQKIACKKLNKTENDTQIGVYDCKTTSLQTQ